MSLTISWYLHTDEQKRVREILKQLNEETPCALARFNDGECGIIRDKSFVAARGDQKGCVKLQLHLIDAILHEQKNYWKGYPCPKCFPKLWDYVKNDGYYNPLYEHNTMAVVNTNRNLEIFSEGLQEVLKGRSVVWVSGEDQVLDELDFRVVKHIKVPLKNAWAQYNQLVDECSKWAVPRYVFLFSCGPVARVLVKNLFEDCPNTTFLDIGDTYSPITRGVSRKCHTHTLNLCRSCN